MILLGKRSAQRSTPVFALAGTGNAQNNDANTIDLALPAGIQNDDLIEAHFMIRRFAGSSVTAPTGWTEVLNEGSGAVGASNPRMLVLRRDARGTADETGTINFTWARGNTSSTVTGMGRIYVIRSVNLSGTITEGDVKTQDSSGVDTTVTMPDVTPSVGVGRRCIAFFALLGGSGTVGDPTGETWNNWTQPVAAYAVTTPGNGGTLAIFQADNQGSIAGGEATLSAGENWLCYGRAYLGVL